MKRLTLIKNSCAALLAVLAFGSQLRAQNEPVIAHFAYHTNVFNPAVSGNTRDIYLGALYRQQ